MGMAPGCSHKGGAMVSNGGPHMLPVTSSPGPQPHSTLAWPSHSSLCHTVTRCRGARPQHGRARCPHHPLPGPQLALSLLTMPAAERLVMDTLTFWGATTGPRQAWHQAPLSSGLSQEGSWARPPGPAAFGPRGRAGDPPSHWNGTGTRTDGPWSQPLSPAPHGCQRRFPPALSAPASLDGGRCSLGTRWGPGPWQPALPQVPGEENVGKRTWDRASAQAAIPFSRVPQARPSPCPEASGQANTSQGTALLPSPRCRQGPTALAATGTGVCTCLLPSPPTPAAGAARVSEKLEALPIAMFLHSSAGWVPLLPPANQACRGEQGVTLTQHPASTAGARNEGSFFLTEVLPCSCSSLGTLFATLQGQL